MENRALTRLRDGGSMKRLLPGRLDICVSYEVISPARHSVTNPANQQDRLVVELSAVSARLCEQPVGDC